MQEREDKKAKALVIKQLSVLETQYSETVLLLNSKEVQHCFITP